MGSWYNINNFPLLRGVEVKTKCALALDATSADYYDVSPLKSHQRR